MSIAEAQKIETIVQRKRGGVVFDEIGVMFHTVKRFTP